MRIAIISIAFIFYSNITRSQALSNDFTTSFAFKVHSIDDFFDRFNFRKNTGFQNFLKNNYPDQQLTRPQIIASLFNNTNSDLMANPFLKEFIDQSTDSISPLFVHYSDNDWYAELNCKVIFQGKPKNLILVLKVEKAINNSYRWSVISAHADFLRIKPSLTDSLMFMKNVLKPVSVLPNGFMHSLSPVSHGIDFVNIINFFEDKSNASDYLNFTQKSVELNRLILLIKKSAIKFDRINSVTYHLLQFEDWIIRVEETRSNTKTAGWRINKLLKITPFQKVNYLRNRLYIKNNLD